MPRAREAVHAVGRLLLHQLAEATVRAMLRQLVAALVVEPAPPNTSAQAQMR